jgi:TonB-dependent SusC/RagA subfamily outer membrane receptor
MENYLIYIGKSALAAGAFYLVFLALFQNRKQFVFNRIYLPVSLAISFIIPLITFTTIQYVEPLPPAANGYSFLPETIQPVETSHPQFHIEGYHYLIGIYILGTAFFLFRLCHGYLKALQIIRKSRMHKFYNTTVNITGMDVHPFSFFNKIVLSEKTLTHPNLGIIVAHEKIHVNEKHTFDILFTEILFILQWFNPFAWLIKDAVKNNLEYKVDEQIAKTTNVKTYQLAMVALADKKGVAPFLTALNGSQLRSRIIMMKRSAANKYATLKKLALLPLLAILIMGLANREVRTEVIPGQEDQTSLRSRAQEESTPTGKIIQENYESLPGETISNKNGQNEPGSESNDNENNQSGVENETSIFSEGEHLTQVTDTGHSEKLVSKFNPYNPDNKLYIIDGMEYKGDINDIDVNDIRRIDVLKEASANALYGEKGKNGVVLITTKSGNKPNLSPENDQIEIKGKVISRHNHQPIPGATIFFTANDNKSGTISNNSGEFSIRTNNSNVFFEFLSEGYHKKEFVWDGNKELLVEMVPGNNSGITDTTEEKTKWEKMLEKAGIGRYPEGKEPVVIQDGYETLYNANDISDLYNPDIIKSIRYKKNTNIDIKRKELAKNGFIEIKTTLPKQDKKLYIIDGEEVLLKNQKPSVYIYPKQLQKMKELSKEEAVKKFGSKAKHGAVEITTKSNPLTNKAGVSRANNPLIVIDGIVTGFKSADHINPADIQSVTVLKDAKAAERYGEKGRDGVIEITLKPVKIYGEFQLRKFIANEIKYPLLAQKSNIEKTVNLFVRIDNEGIIDIISEESSATDFNLDEVVVVGYGPQDSVVTGYPSKDAADEARKVKEQLLVDETKRVINKIPKLDIEKFKGKTVGIKMKFMLQ